MTIELFASGAREHLKSKSRIRLYLDESIQEDPGDGSLIRAALGNIVRVRGVAQLSRNTGLTRGGIYKALSPDGNPELSTVVKIIKALGLRLHVVQACHPSESAEYDRPWQPGNRLAE
jgi:probable addiction module antidote protein